MVLVCLFSALFIFSVLHNDNVIVCFNILLLLSSVILRVAVSMFMIDMFSMIFFLFLRFVIASS